MSNVQFQNLKSFTGTAKQFEDARVYLNGAELNQISVNAFAKHGFFKVVGEGPKPARGRTPKLYEVVTRPGFRVQQRLVSAAAAESVTTEAVSNESSAGAAQETTNQQENVNSAE